MTKRYWLNPADRDAVAPSAEAPRGDEFGPEVAGAIAELRQRHGLGTESCQHAGNSPEELDDLRVRLRELVPGLNRRGFLRLSGAAAVFSLAGCGPNHPDTIAPWSAQPEGTTLGTPQFYSSTLRDSGQPVAVMVKSYDGRPIKIEGNPDDPVGRGRCDTRTQAALLNLYDPDRLQHGPLQRQGETVTAISWKDLDQAVGNALKQGKVGLISGPIDSPAHKRLIAGLAAGLPGRFQHAVLEAYPRTAEALARQQAFGDASLPTYHLAEASVLVAFGDFLGGPHQGLGEQVEFGDFRRQRRAGDSAPLGQVFAFEPTFSQLGTCADLRQRVPAQLQPAVAWRLAEAVALALGLHLPAQAQQLVDGSRAAVDALMTPLTGGSTATILALAAERLVAAKKAGGHSLVWAGGANLQGADGGLALQLAVAWLNASLGNEGVSVRTPSAGHGALVDDGSAGALLDAAARGEVQTLILWGVNPAYIWPAKAAGLDQVGTLVALADRLDESAVAAHYIVPLLHGLESWGDAELRPGIYSIQQPCLPPLWDSRAAEESLMAFAAAAGVAQFQDSSGKPADPNWRSVVARTTLWQAPANGVVSWLEVLRGGWAGEIRATVRAVASENDFWTAALVRGVVEAPLAVAAAPALTLDDHTAIAAPAAATGLSLVLTASRTMRDGACLNNAWLQELPDPVSKICWDTYLAVSPIDADHLGLVSNQVAHLTVGDAALEVPVHVQEGQDPGTIELFLGWGRTHAGEVAELCPTHGGYRINGFALADARPLPLALPATLGVGTGHYVLASPQGHDYREGRPVAFDEVVGEAPAVAEQAPLWKAGTDGKPEGDVSAFGRQVAYTGHKWGMTVDMNTCIGCNACTVACTAENNVPTVGRDEVRKNRVMHWIRIHRYYTGSFDPKGDAAMVRRPVYPGQLLDVEVIHQPMLCQHCDNAPCEPVCPANATMHNDEGVSQQIYNRCIGTRYCANNCPYKARRFNWYDYSAYRAGPVGAGSPVTRIVNNLRTTGKTSSPAELAHAPLQMLLNPEVTVRSRGVMEKCSLCIQRIRIIHDQERIHNRRYVDGSVTTACAQSCPTKALVFGDLNDPASEVVRTASSSTSAFKVLDEELNTRPAVTYLRRLRNRPATADEATAAREQAANEAPTTQIAAAPAPAPAAGAAP